MLGIVKIEEGLDLAKERKLDLVEISANAEPPVCKILDFGKYKYELRKKSHESKKKQKTVVTIVCSDISSSICHRFPNIDAAGSASLRSGM